MKRFIFLFLLTSFFYSCISVEFKKPQPIKGKKIIQFPNELIGTYLNSDNDTITIANTYFKATSLTIELNNNSKPSNKVDLSDNIFLKQMDKKYILNMKDEKNKSNWSIIIINKTPNGLLINTFNVDDKDFLTTLKTITKTEELRDEDGKLEKIIIDPSENEFKKILATPSLFNKSEMIKIN
ncbi:MAG: hypothetical protein KDD24_09055 [Flavobacteriales bacterium]|nr:hypothetical protein [Flavobacteriales bacterium]